MVCRAGRECKVGADGEAACTCIESCPDHFVPVCGSNNQSYDNFCLMHRDACLTGVHISLKKKGYCSNKSLKKKSKTEKQKEETHFEPGKLISLYSSTSKNMCCIIVLCQIKWCAFSGKETPSDARLSTISAIIHPIKAGTDRASRATRNSLLDFSCATPPRIITSTPMNWLPVRLMSLLLYGLLQPPMNWSSKSWFGKLESLTNLRLIGL